MPSKLIIGGLLKGIFFTFFLFAFVWSSSVYTQENSDTAVSVNTGYELVVPSVSASSIKVDGDLNDPAWKNSVKAGNFVEIEPGDNTPAPVETEVMIVYDEDKLYFGFICHDSEMSKLRTSMTDRDKIFDDDFVGLILDTYRDYKQSYEFYVNPYGIQGDLVLEPNYEDTSPDYIWESDAKIYNDRWTAEIAIPFKSIRFPDKNEVSFGLHFIRTRPRDTRLQMSWVPISRDNPSLLSQEGVIKGIKNVKRGKNFEILPYVIGSVSGFLRNIKDPSSKFVADSIIKGDAGVNLKYCFTSNLTGEIAVNPDFSQVESDAGVIDVNTSSAVQYPEKRPFFLEGSNIFRTQIQTAYSRMINDPIIAAKLTGKIGDFNIGYISAYDENTPFIVPYDYGSYFVVGEKLKSLSNILRVKRDLKGESYVGIIATDREVGKAYNRVLGFDGSVNFLNNYYFNWQIMSYNTREVNDTNLFNKKVVLPEESYYLKFDGEKISGFGGYLSFVRNARHWNFNVNYYDTPPETRRDVGYVGSVNWRELNFWTGYTIYPENSFFLRIEPQMNGGVDVRYSGSHWQTWFIPSFYILMKNRLELSGGFLAVNDEEYKGVYHRKVNRGWVNFNINTSGLLWGGSYIEVGKYIVRFKTPSFVGYGLNTQLWCTIRPTSRLQVEINHDYSELSDKPGGAKLYAGYILRDKTTFQFTKNFFMRLILQFDSFSKRFDIDPLLSYKWNPFTIFYVGSTHDINDYGKSGDNYSRFVETNRQFFAKFQYLFRM
jgi:hypothetical protein